MPLLYKSFPVTGTEDAGGGLKVLGRCSDGQLDHDGDIVSPSWMAQAVNEWLRTYPAVRLQHRVDAPVGKGLEAWQDPDGSTWLRSLIVSGKAKKLVKSGVLAAHSVGIAEPVTKQSPRARRWQIVGGRLAEVSLVDSPSNARCGIEVVKSVDGVPRYIGKAYGKASKPGKASRHGRGGRLERQARKAERDAELTSFADWLDSPDPAVREQARAFLGRGRVLRANGTVAKSGKVKVTKGGRVELPADEVAAMFLHSGDPRVREMVLDALGGDYGPG